MLNGLTRPFFGWVSDHIGRENTMFIAFLIEGIGIYALLLFAADPLMFVILSGLVFFAWGEIYSLFPATCTDIYGRKFATTNYGLLYTAKGTASLLVPLGNVLTTSTGSWTAVFIIAAVLNIVAAVMALVVLKPMRARRWRRADVGPDRSGLTTDGYSRWAKTHPSWSVEKCGSNAAESVTPRRQTRQTIRRVSATVHRVSVGRKGLFMGASLGQNNVDCGTRELAFCQ